MGTMCIVAAAVFFFLSFFLFLGGTRLRILTLDLGFELAIGLVSPAFPYLLLCLLGFGLPSRLISLFSARVSLSRLRGPQIASRLAALI